MLAHTVKKKQNIFNIINNKKFLDKKNTSSVYINLIIIIKLFFLNKLLLFLLLVRISAYFIAWMKGFKYQ